MEETKEPEPPQTTRPSEGAAMSAPSVDAPSRVKQQHIESVQLPADANQATLLAVQQLSQQLRETREQLRESIEKLEAKQREELKEMRLDIHSQSTLLQNV